MAYGICGQGIHMNGRIWLKWELHFHDDIVWADMEVAFLRLKVYGNDG